ncbi:hypothetical protein DID80_05495, partial [Candidatus Marinamargulisbacteria bacterium SCGC AAA071-K20]
MIMKTIKSLIILVMLFGYTTFTFADAPMTIMFDAILATKERGRLDTTNLNSGYDVGFSIVGFENGSEEVIEKWYRFYENVHFANGHCNIIIQSDTNGSVLLEPKHFNVSNPHFRIEVYIGDEILTTLFPIPSTPYAVQAKVAETVLNIPASSIRGEFVTTVNINADLVVDGDTFFVDSALSRVGIKTKLPEYPLDVQGTINAAAYTIDGEEIQNKLSWTKYENLLFYTDGFVGISTSNPQYELDVVGTVNASEYFRQGDRLENYLDKVLSWNKAPTGPKDIYFNDGSHEGRLGIGTSINLSERLNVKGAIKLGPSIQIDPKAGTIEYNVANGDFFGYTSDGVPQSLTGARVVGSPQSGHMAVWRDNHHIEHADLFVWKDSKLGIGTSKVPSAQVHIVGDATNDSFLKIENEFGDPIMVVNKNGKIGVGTATPTEDFQVDGTINAKNFLINGAVYQGSEGSFWNQGNFNQIFYDTGNVGIGTSLPRNLLEISSATGNVAITFDIDKEDLYTIGVDAGIEDAFVISRGGDLETPVFVFSGDRIGVGLKNPQANLHVSGNAGFLVTGRFGVGDALPATGKGVRMFFYPKKAAFRSGYVLSSNWDDLYIGDYSTAMGFDSLAAGTASSVIGGYKNKAIGEYSTVVGGFENSAEGDYSFVGGHNAKTSSSAVGSFVWADYTPTANPFESVVPGQFLIRANNGVGIGTTDTEKSALSIRRNYPGHNLVLMGSSSKPDSQVAFTTEGKMSIGSSDPGNAALYIASGNVGIGTNNPDAMLTIETQQTAGYIMKIMAPNRSPTPVMVITASGNIGLGVDNPQAGIDLGEGDILATNFLMVDPDDPDSVVILQPSSGSPWADPSDPDTGNGNTYRTMGYVGIGTPSPNSLLELSNRNTRQDPPVITFDLYNSSSQLGTDYYSMGLVTNNSRVYYVIQDGGSLDKENAIFTVSTESVGIGIGANDPIGDFQVSGNFVISGNMSVATTNINPLFDLLIDGTFSVNDLFIDGERFTPKETPWATNLGALTIYYTSGNVGIGTNDPQTALEVVGDVSVNSLVLRDNFNLDGELLANIIKFQDIATTNVHTGQIFVQSNNLVYVDPEGVSKTLSSPISRDLTPGSGPLAFWVDAETIGNVPMFWNHDNTELSGTTNVSIRNYFRDGNGLVVSSNVEMTNKHALGLDVELDHQGLTNGLLGFTGQKINMSILRDWGKDEGVLELKGMDIKFLQAGTGKLVNNARAVGLYVDVSDLEIDENSEASKYAALFLGGNVGIGTTTPDDDNDILAEGEVLLEVNGVVSANFVDISGVNVSQLLVNKDNNGFSAKKDLGGKSRVGIGTLSPSTELEVVGLVSANSMIITEGLRAVSLNIGDGNFFVSSNGYIGIGTTDPNNQLEFHKSIDSNLAENFISEKIEITVDNSNGLGESFEFLKNLTGFDVKMKSNGASNQIGETAIVRGIKVDMTGLKSADSTVTVIGLDIDVQSATDPDEVRYAALFNGGFVGIGTDEPLAELHVSGNIHATNLHLEQALITARATFDTLIVNDVASMNNVTVNNIVVRETIRANVLEISTGLSIPDASFSTLNSRIVTVNELAKIQALIVSQDFTAFKGQFTKSLGIGIAPPTTGLEVSGDIRAFSLNITDTLTLTNSATLDVNNGQLYVDSNGLVGIGTKLPTAPLDIVNVPEGFLIPYDATKSKTWNPIRLQTKSNGVNQAVGIILVPDAGTPSSSVGSGIAAVRASGGGSHLAFISDPISGLPAERMRISQEGFVGIGTTNPQYGLDVVGDANFQGDVTINGVLNVSTITANGTLRIIPTDVLTIEGLTTFNANLIAEKAIYLKQNSENPASRVGYNTLFVDGEGDLLYLIAGGTTQNLTAAFHGHPNYIPFIDANGNLSNNSLLQWDDALNKFIIGTGNQVALYEISSTINSSITATTSLQTVKMTVQDRSSYTATTLKGLDIIIESTPKKTQGSVDFGRLANGETAVGLYVDVSDVVANTTIDDVQASGYKYAGLFKGGNVGIGVSDPLAGVHIGPSLTGDALRVDSSYIDGVGDKQVSNHALFVSTTGNVGLGTATPLAQLSVEANEELGLTDYIMHVSSGNKVLMVIQKNGNMGIGTNSPSVELDISGTVSANTAILNGITATTMNVGDGTLVITDTGIIGIGTTNVQGNLTFYKALNEVKTDPFISQKIEMVINGANGAAKPFHLDRNLTGIELEIKSDSTNDTLQGTEVATGVSINMKSLGIKSGANAKVIGLDVNVGNGEGRYAAIFLGGNVGIGTANPTVELAVSGDIKANSLELAGSMIANIVTMN